MDVRAVVMTILLVGYAPSIVLCGMALLSYSFLLRFSYRIRLMAPIALTATAFGSVVVIAYVIKGFANEPFHPIVLIAGLVLQVLHFIPMVLAVLTPIPFIEKFTTVKQRYVIAIAYSLTVLPIVLAYKFLGLFTGEDVMRLLPKGYYFDLADLYLTVLLPAIPFYVGALLLKVLSLNRSNP